MAGFALRDKDGILKAQFSESCGGLLLKHGKWVSLGKEGKSCYLYEDDLTYTMNSLSNGLPIQVKINIWKGDFLIQLER